MICVDEKTGIQAIEREYPDLPMKPKELVKIEFEYHRHGTQCLIGNFEVATGLIMKPIVSQQRTEKDFLLNIQELVNTDPKAEWIFILDQLNTHKSDSLVRWIAKMIDYQGDLGINCRGRRRGKGILCNMNSRMTFLEDTSHKIRFLFTPKHCSWMNQIEIWFSKLSREFIGRSSFSSLGSLREGILDYIDYWNARAKPFKWTYEGKVLQA